MAVSANQSQAEWLSDILAALGFTGGGVSPGGGQKVQGTAADGLAPVGNPVWVAGWDGALTRALKTDTSGRPVAVGDTADGSAISGTPGILGVGGIEAGTTSRRQFRTYANAADALATFQGLICASVGYGLNAAGTFDRIRTAKADGSALGTVGVLASVIHAWDGATYQGILADANKSLKVALINTAGGAFVGGANFTDANSASQILPVVVGNWNEANYDRVRNNTDVTVLTSAARTTTQTVTFTNYNSSYLRVVLDMTTVGTGSVTLSIDAQDAISGKWVNLLTGAAVVTNSTNVYEVGPALAVTANASANKALSRNMRIVVTANNTNSATYSVGRQLTGV